MNCRDLYLSMHFCAFLATENRIGPTANRIGPTWTNTEQVVRVH